MPDAEDEEGFCNRYFFPTCHRYVCLYYPTLIYGITSHLVF